MAYMTTIIRAQIEFEDPAWRTYDEPYRDKAATPGNRKWSEIDPHLYNKIFTGWAKKMAICSHCGNTGHTAAGCKRKQSWDSLKSEEVKHRSLNPCWDYNSRGQCQYGDTCRFRQSVERSILWSSASTREERVENLHSGAKWVQGEQGYQRECRLRTPLQRKNNLNWMKIEEQS